jgi:pimeloyl-ACP methyl ester carboxylesterase
MRSPAQVAPADTFLETARYLQSGTETLFAVHTSPARARTDLGVLLVHSGPNNFSAHRNGVWTDISRRLAREGIPSLRSDFAGTGESSGEFAQRLDGQPVTDVTAAMDALRATGCQRLLIVGSCFGGLPSITAGVARGDVAGMILVSPPLVMPGAGGIASFRERLGEVINRQTLRTVATNREYRRWFFARLASLAWTRARVQLRRLAARTPASRTPEPGAGTRPGRGLLLESELARLVMTGNHIELVYGTSDDNLGRIEGDAEASRTLRLLRDRRPAGLVWSVFDGAIHGLEDVALQEELIRLILGRACDLTRLWDLAGVLVPGLGAEVGADRVDAGEVLGDEVHVVDDDAEPFLDEDHEPEQAE